MKKFARLRWWLWIGAVIVSFATLNLPPVDADGPDYAGLVIDFGGHTETRCVSFSGSISGMEALRQHFSLQTAFSGGVVCKIDDTGCPGGDASCWCQCRDPNEDCRFWSYWHRDDGGWEFSDAGAKIYQVRHGDVEGWKWAEQSFEDPDSTPPNRSFEQICAEYLVTDTPTPTDTPIPTDTPVPTNTPSPTATSLPTNTPEPTETPEPDPSIEFSVSPGQIEAGQCATLGWKVQDARAIYLDGQGVTGDESRQVCPSTGAHTYQLRVVGLDDREFTRELLLTVVQSAAPAAAASTETPASAASTPNAVQNDEVAPSDPGGDAIVADASPQVGPTPAPLPHQPQPEGENTSVPRENAQAPTEPTVVAGATALAMNQTLPAETPPALQRQAVSAPAQPACSPEPTVTQSERSTFGGILTSKITWFIVLGSTAIGVVGLGGLTLIGTIIVLIVVYRRFASPATSPTDDELYHDDRDSRG